MKIVALVVTYNRKTLLCECIDAILNQTRKPDKIVVIDNASTDGTEKLFIQGGIFSNLNIEYRRMDSNTGGAGGFYEGIKYCSKLGDWIWLMDDDTIPDNKALEGLMESLTKLSKERISFLASTVVGPNGEPMNLPKVDMRPNESGYAGWYFHLNEKLVKIESATFVSLLLNTDAVNEIGLPIPWYFIWGDDTEYTMRLTKYYGNAYFCGNSNVLHKRENAKILSVWEEENFNRLDMYFYFVRNLLINISKYGLKKDILIQITKWNIQCLMLPFKRNIKYKFKKALIVQKGILAYLIKSY